MTGVDIYNGKMGTRQDIFFFRARSVYEQMRIKRDKINMPGGYGQLEFLEIDMPQLLGQDPQWVLQRYLQERRVILAAVGPARVQALEDRAARTAWKDYRVDFIEAANRAARPNEPGVLEPPDLDGFFAEIMQRYMTNCSEAFARVLSLRALPSDTVTSLTMRFEDDAKATEDNHMTT